MHFYFNGLQEIKIIQLEGESEIIFRSVIFLRPSPPCIIDFSRSFLPTYFCYDRLYASYVNEPSTGKISCHYRKIVCLAIKPLTLLKMRYLPPYFFSNTFKRKRGAGRTVSPTWLMMIVIFIKRKSR